MEITKEMQNMMDKAKIGIFTSANKFISTIVFSMNHVWDDSIPTAKVNGKEARYNPKFMQSLSNQERVFVLAHEAWHVALNHINRVGDRDPNKFNKAGDYVNNQLLADSGFTLIKGVYQDDKYRGLSTDEVYELLDDEEESNDPIGNDIESNTGLSQEESDKLDTEITMILVKALTASKAAGEDPGTIPSSITRMIQEKLYPRLPWQTLLKRYMRAFNKNNYSWTRPNKRFFPEFILPSMYSNELGLIAIALDTSGSNSDKELGEQLTEVLQIHRIFKPKKMILMDCDYKIHNVHEVKEDTKIKELKFSGKGGTRFDPVLKYLNDLKELPLVLIYFTDLYGPMPKIIPKYPIVWICNSDHKPFDIGTTIYMK